MAKKLIVLIATTVVAAVAALSGAATAPKVKDVFRLAQVVTRGEDGGGEPSIAAAKDGTLYLSYPGRAGMGFFRSVDLGVKWTKGALADKDSGDTTVNVDSGGAVYQSNLSGTLQVDIYKSLNGGKTWSQKGVTGSEDNPSSKNSSNSPFLVDRQWVDAYIPPGKTTKEARVYVTYHDWIAGLMWINVSKDGGKTFSEQKTVMTDTAALANGFCNVIPGGVRVVQSGPRAGRVYVLWMAGNAATNPTTGCNETQMDTFGQIWSAYSDDEGATWTDQLVYDAGAIGHDASYIFADLTLDDAGNPYTAFAINDADPPHTGGDGDQWNIFVSASFDGGKTWNGKSDGTGSPYKVTTTSGTHVFPAITAGDPGKVAVAYLGTDSVIPQIPYGKAFPGGDPKAKWNVFVARSLNLKTGSPAWSSFRVTPKPMHTGDICNLGIFCSAFRGISNRDLLDFIDIVGDPDGMLHVAYTDTENSKDGSIMAVNQIAGTPISTANPLIGKPRILPKLPKVPTKVLAEKLAGTGVGDWSLLGLLLFVGAGLILRGLRRTA
jgi:hypothetical protein